MGITTFIKTAILYNNRGIILPMGITEGRLVIRHKSGLSQITGDTLTNIISSGILKTKSPFDDIRQLQYESVLAFSNEITNINSFPFVAMHIAKATFRGHGQFRFTYGKQFVFYRGITREEDTGLLFNISNIELIDDEYIINYSILSDEYSKNYYGVIS